jgi:hypothetical protein
LCVVLPRRTAIALTGEIDQSNASSVAARILPIGSGGRDQTDSGDLICDRMVGLILVPPLN